MTPRFLRFLALFLALCATAPARDTPLSNPTVTGTLTVGSGQTFAIFGTNATTRTGTGAIVLGTSPSLTSPVLTTATVVTSFLPSTDDGAALGNTTHNFSDLFLASGAVINYANGNVALTHSSGILTLGTGDLRITTAGTNSASVVTVGGTQTLTNKSLTSPVSTGTPTVPTAAQGTNTTQAASTAYVQTELAVDPAWIAPTLVNSWVNYGSAEQVAGYRLRNGHVEIRGGVKSGSVNPIFVLPAGYRPAADHTFVVSSDPGLATVYVQASGSVYLAGYAAGGTNAFVSLAGISFSRL